MREALMMYQDAGLDYIIENLRPYDSSDIKVEVLEYLIDRDIVSYKDLVDFMLFGEVK